MVLALAFTSYIPRLGRARYVVTQARAWGFPERGAGLPRPSLPFDGRRKRLRDRGEEKERRIDRKAQARERQRGRKGGYVWIGAGVKQL